MKVVVTGATGNIGTAVVRRLLAGEEHDVLGLARRLPDRTASHRLRFSRVDLTDDADEETLRWAVRDADAVVHLAWGFQPSHDLAYLERLGVDGTRRVLAAARDAEVPHLVHMSSVGAYAPREGVGPVDESYPATGVPTSPYSSHKAAVEAMLDEHETTTAAPLVTRLRPGIVGQRAAGSALLRYGIPGFVPARSLTWLPVLPLDRTFAVPIVHADDVAAAVDAVLHRRPGGAFNLAAEPVLRPAHVAAALGARHVHVPARALRTGVDLAWRARVQPLDPGWLDLAMAVPSLDTTRAREELGWRPAHDARAVLAEVVAGLRDAASGPTPVLRPRTPARQLAERLQRGPITSRRQP